MSEVLPYVGAAIGSFWGPTGAQIGFAIGSLGAVALAPDQKTQGPRLEDLKVTGFSYGTPIPFIQGTVRTGGSLVWASDRREIATTTTSGGKGGPKNKNTTYTYEIDCLFKLSSNELSGLLRVWDNGKLIYSVDADSSDGSLIASSETDAWRRITFYSGDSAQLPDPTYEAAVGAGNAPACRGEGTVFIEGLQLGQSGQMRQLTFEVGTNLDDAVMQNYQDFSPNRHEIRLGSTNPAVNRFGGTTLSPAKFGAAGVFNGGNTFSPGEALEVYPVSGARIAPPEFSIRCWLYDIGDDSVDNHVLAFGNDTGTPAGLWVYRRSSAFNGRIQAYMRGFPGFTITADRDHPKNQWFYFELSTVGQNAYMFIDGVLVGTALNYNPDQTQHVWVPGNWCIGGRYDWAPCWVGYIDDFVYRTTGGNTVDYDPPTEPHNPDQFTEIYIPFYRVDTVERGTETLRNVVERLCERAGMPAGTYDASALDAITKPVRSLSVSQIGGTRATLDMLAKTYFFQQYCTDKVYFVPRAQSPVATIAYEELGTAPQMESSPEPLSMRLMSDIEIPAQEAITYANVNDDYQTDTQYSDRLNTTQTSTSTASVALGFTPSEAKAIADARVADNAISVIGTTIALPRSRSALTPGDSVLVVGSDGSVYRMALGRLTAKAGVMTFEARMEDPSVFTQAGITGDDYQPQTEVVAISDTYLEVLDIPQLRDADNGVGLYVAARGLTSHWPGASIMESTDNLSYAERATVTERAVIGLTTTALTNWTGGNVFDDSSSVAVNVGSGTLSSVTRDQLIESRTVNAMLIGDEIVQYRTATAAGGGVYTLTGFLRGRRGTEWAMTGHTSMERVVLLEPAGMRRVSQTSADLMASRYFKGVSFGRSLSSAATQNVVNTGASVKPLSPVNARANRNSADTVITWDRRTRMETRFLGPLSSSVPLGEASEAYQVDIYSNNTFTTVVRTLSSTSPSVTYTNANQVADFGSARTVLYVRIYQLSETAGRGFPLQATI